MVAGYKNKSDLGELIMKLLKSDVGIITILTLLLFGLVKFQDASAGTVATAADLVPPPAVSVLAD